MRPCTVPGAISVAGLVAFTSLLGTVARADYVPEIPGLGEVPVDARTAALGGAGVAVSEESGAILANPAAIALVRRTETSATLSYQRRELTSDYFDDARIGKRNSGQLSAAGFVYPTPVYRGAFAFGVAYNRHAVFDRDLLRGGTQSGGGVEDELLEESGSMDFWTVGAGVQISPSGFVGASATLVAGELARRSELAYSATGVAYDYAGTVRTDLSGIRASLGGLFFLSPRMRLGIRLDLPHTVTYDGTERSDAGDDFVVEDEVSYPFSTTAGVATRTGQLVITGEASFTPYSLLELNAERLRTEERIEGYRDVVVLRLGAEYTFPVSMRVRGGYRFEPDPYRLLVAEVRNDAPVEAVMEEAEFDGERHVVTGGVGFLLEDALNLDLAAEWATTTKRGTNVAQTDDLVRFFVTTSYRF